MKNISKCLAFAALAPCAALSQGLYSIAPADDEASDSLPLKWTVGANLGFDDNPTPLSNSDDESLYASAFVQANMVSVSPQTTWDLMARVGGLYYIDGLDGSNADDFSPNASLGLNVTHRVSERLRLSSRNLLSFEREPDYSYGLSSDRAVGNYFRYTTDNSVGYRWSERFATITGVVFSGVAYEDLDRSDYNRIQFYNQFRYRATPATVYTAEYRYAMTDHDTSGDATSHYILGGVEHRISAASAIILRAGAQLSERDGGDSKTQPFVEGVLKSQMTEQLGVQAFVRYSTEDWSRSIRDGSGSVSVYDSNQTLRFGLKASYALNPRLTLFGGANVIFRDYEDEVVGTFGEGSETLYNLNAGASFQVQDNLFLTGSYNFTTSDSDFGGSREYDRNRVQVGVQATF
ncbi:MAG: outer membrane beta-barrel protein [Verrucomicrobiota bacterium JB023]|nr:outer membrane beta-barrel protein [Verrucomicrobiota bacterium JB023]